MDPLRDSDPDRRRVQIGSVEGKAILRGAHITKIGKERGVLRVSKGINLLQIRTNLMGEHLDRILEKVRLILKVLIP